MRSSIFSISALILTLGLAGCAANPSPGQEQPQGNRQASASPVKLKDIIAQDTTNTAPKSGEFYISVVSAPDGNIEIAPTQCVSRSFWAFIRKSIGVTGSATVMLTVKITSSDPIQTITVPIFFTSANEVSESGNGSTCTSSYKNIPLNFTYNSKLNPTFDVEMQIHLANAINSEAVKNLLSDAESLVSLIGTATATPAALATKLADPKIKELSTKIDNVLENQWTNSNDLDVHEYLAPALGGGVVYDRISYKMPTLISGDGGPEVGTWAAGGTIFLKYSGPLFQNNGVWLDRDSILIKTIVPSTAATESTLEKIVLNGDVTTGFDKQSLVAASNIESLSDACSKLSKFLDKFLISDDSLVATYAILRESAYEKNPNLREKSGCLNAEQLSRLTMLRADYTFSQQIPSSADSDANAANNKMFPILTALLSQNPILITSQITSPSSNFDLVLGPQKTDYYVGDDAVQKLSTIGMSLVCYQTRPNHDLSSIAAVAVYGGHRTGAVVAFDANNKPSSIIVMSSDAVANTLGIQKSDWLNSSTNPRCVVDSGL